MTRGTLEGEYHKYEPSINELSNWVKQTQPNVHVDETPWSVQRIKEWVWVVANSDFCLFTVADTRSGALMEWLAGIAQQDFHATGQITVIVQDKASVHRSQLAQQQILRWREQGLFLFFLPPYSPQMNRIED